MSGPSTAELLLRMVLSLAIMGGLSWLALRLGRSRRGGTVRGGVARRDPIAVCGRRQLSRSTSVTVVRVGSRTLLLGVAESGVQVLAEGDDLVAEEPTVAPGDGIELLTVPGRAGTHASRASGPGPARMGVVDALRELTARR